jgi:hypothetical protein
MKLRWINWYLDLSNNELLKLSPTRHNANAVISFGIE